MKGKTTPTTEGAEDHEEDHHDQHEDDDEEEKKNVLVRRTHSRNAGDRKSDNYNFHWFSRHSISRRMECARRERTP